MACREARHRSESLFAMPRSAFGPLEDGVVSGFSGRMGVLRDEGERGHPNNHRTSRLSFERQPRRSPAAMLHSHIPKMADTSRATVRHTTLETACKLALALGVRAEDLLENDARESIDKWHSPAIPGIREQHERDRRPDGIGPKGCRASSPFGSGDMEFKPFEPFEPFRLEQRRRGRDREGYQRQEERQGLGWHGTSHSHAIRALPFYVPSSQSLPMRLYLASADPPACERTAPSAHRI